MCQIEFGGTSGFPLELTVLSRHATLSLLFMDAGCFFHVLTLICIEFLTSMQPRGKEEHTKCPRIF